MSRLVLIAGSDARGRGSLAVHLRCAGYQAVEASSGKEAVRLVAERSPDAVIVSIPLADRDGMRACREIRDMEGHRGTPILICTEGGTLEHLDAVLSGRADDVFLGSFGSQAVVRRLAHLLPDGAEAGKERRAESRFRADLPLAVLTAGIEGGTVVLRSRVVDMSGDGLAYRHVPEPPIDPYVYEAHTIGPLHPLYRYAARNPAGETVRFVIDLPDRRRVNALGRIVFARSPGEAETCGAQFVALSNEDRSRIVALEERKPPGGGASPESR